MEKKAKTYGKVLVFTISPEEAEAWNIQEGNYYRVSIEPLFELSELNYDNNKKVESEDEDKQKVRQEQSSPNKKFKLRLNYTKKEGLNNGNS